MRSPCQGQEALRSEHQCWPPRRLVLSFNLLGSKSLKQMATSMIFPMPYFMAMADCFSLGSTNNAITVRFLKVCYDEIRQFPDLFAEPGSSNRPTVLRVDGRPSPAQEPRKAAVAAVAAAEPENDSPDQCPASSGKRVFVSAAVNVGDDEREATLTTARAVKSRTKRVSSMATDLLSRLQAGSVPMLHCNVHAVWICRCLC